MFIDDLLEIVKDAEDKNGVGEEKLVVMKLCKDKEFRSLEIRARDRMRRI